MCLDDQILNTYLDGELAEPWKSQVEEHLNYCKGCAQRFQALKALRERMQDAALSEDEIKPRQDRVLAMLEKNYLSKKKKESFLRRQFRLTTPQLMGVAAAFVVVFVGSWSIFGGKSQSSIDLPEDVMGGIDKSSIIQVVDKESSSKGLDSYTIEEIIDYFDAKGYTVEVTKKAITPID